MSRYIEMGAIWDSQIVGWDENQRFVPSPPPRHSFSCPVPAFPLSRMKTPIYGT